MSPVLEASFPKTNLTTSNYYKDDELLNFLDEDDFIIRDRQMKFPDLSMCIVETPEGNWVLVNEGTSGSEMSIGKMELDLVDNIDSPLMPPKRKFKIHVRVRSIKKGRPSICDEVEYE